MINAVGRLGLRDVVTFTDHQSPVQFLADVDVLLVTSRFEGVATSTIEGMAAGRPFLGLDVGSLAALARQSGAGWVVPRGPTRSRTASLLAAQIVRLARTPDTLSVAGADGKRFARSECTWERWVETFETACRLASERQ